MGNDGTGGNDRVAANGNTRQNDGTGTNPYIVVNADGRCGHALLVDAPCGVAEVVVEGCDDHALRHVDMAADTHRTDDRGVEADAGVVADDHVAHGIVDAAERLDNAPASQPEAAIGWGVQSYRAVNL